MAEKKLIFASYCSMDDDLTPDVFDYLDNLTQLGPIEIWKDVREIRAGDSWEPEIAEALAKAQLAVLLISPKFLNSKFIITHELPALRERRERDGLRIIPINLKPGPLPEWLKQIEMRPRGKLSLMEIPRNRRGRELTNIVDEISGILQGSGVENAGGPDFGPDRRQNTPCVTLLAATLFNGIPNAEDLARRLSGQIAQLTGLAGQGLLDATSYLIEYYLLKSKGPGMQFLEFFAKEKDRDALISRLKQCGKTGVSGAQPIEVFSDFFNRTRDRETLWKAYFDAIIELGDARRDSVKSISRIRVKLGFVAPQYLLAGLLARFDDDWRPVLNAYQSAIPRPAERNGAFESLQASQWNCWLMWGPSVPICCCRQWRGLFAFQYGYGDENNSVPVLEVPSDAAVPAKALDEIAGKLRVERRAARYAALTGRLRWGPWFLREEPLDKTQTQEFDLAKQDEDDDEEELARQGVAPAQAALYKEDVPANLVLQLEKVDATDPETRVYFSAYYWLIFLVALPPRTPELARVGPSLLRGKRYPDWPERDDQRGRVRDARLWEDLLPVFVHANIGDPAALGFQKRVLVENALQLLHQVWDRRQELFHPDDIAAGIQFHLICASDYSGCGYQLRFPPEDPLLDQLRRRQATEPDRAFAAALMLPAEDETEETRPWGLAGYFSACHFPELVADYYEHVAEVAKSPSK